MIREQEPVGELHLVRMRSLRNGDLPQDSRPLRVGDVEDARADAEVTHVPHVEKIAAAHDLHSVAAALEVGVAHKLETALLERTRIRGDSHRPGLWPV